MFVCSSLVFNIFQHRSSILFFCFIRCCQTIYRTVNLYFLSPLSPPLLWMKINKPASTAMIKSFCHQIDVRTLHQNIVVRVKLIFSSIIDKISSPWRNLSRSFLYSRDERNGGGSSSNSAVSPPNKESMYLFFSLSLCHGQW